MDNHVVKTGEARIPLADAPDARFLCFRSAFGSREHLAIVVGEPLPTDGVAVRLHSACLTGDGFGSLRCDCGEQLRQSVAALRQLGGGVLLYLAQEGRGIGLANKLRAYALQDGGRDTIDADLHLGFEPDERSYAVAAAMLALSFQQTIDLAKTKSWCIEQGSSYLGELVFVYDVGLQSLPCLLERGRQSHKLINVGGLSYHPNFGRA